MKNSDVLLISNSERHLFPTYQNKFIYNSRELDKLSVLHKQTLIPKIPLLKKMFSLITKIHKLKLNTLPISEVHHRSVMVDFY